MGVCEHIEENEVTADILAREPENTIELVSKQGTHQISGLVAP
jgi:hypothetical protein